MVFVGCGRNTWGVLVGVGGTPKPFTLIILTVPFGGLMVRFLRFSQLLFVFFTPVIGLLCSALFGIHCSMLTQVRVWAGKYIYGILVLSCFLWVCTEGRAGRALFILTDTVPHKCTNETIHNNTWAGEGTRRRGLHFSDSTDRK